MAASVSAREVFTEAVRLVLDTWPVLQIAVDNGFGGVHSQQKSAWMVDVIQQYFHDNADLLQEEVEDYVSVLLDQEFDTVADDGSLAQVCGQLCAMFTQCQQGAMEEVRQTLDKLTQRKNSGRANVTAPPPGDDEEESEQMECEVASTSCVSPASTSCISPAQQSGPPPPQVEDGWTVVRKRK